MNATAKKLADLNSIIADCREWQNGGINFQTLKFRLGGYLTQPQIDRLTSGIFRTMSESGISQLVSKTIDL